VVLADLEDPDDEAPVAPQARQPPPVAPAPPKRGRGRPRKHPLAHELAAAFL
jgi:hypothetical protein